MADDGEPERDDVSTTAETTPESVDSGLAEGTQKDRSADRDRPTVDDPDAPDAPEPGPDSPDAPESGQDEPDDEAELDGEDVSTRPSLRQAAPGEEPAAAEPVSPAVRSHRAMSWLARPRPRFWTSLTLFLVLILLGVWAGAYLVPTQSAQEVKDRPGATTAAAVRTTGLGDPPVIPSDIPTGPTERPSRAADTLAGWSARVAEATSIPEVAIQAYGFAQIAMERNDPSCRLGWTTLAAVGKAESDHGRANGAVLQPAGRSTPEIIGPPLDGQGGRPLVRDTDAGAYDGDATYDRELGPLHLLPAVWQQQRIDADSDGVLDPYDIDDSSLALARLLCSGTDSLATATGFAGAIGRYRAGAPYAQQMFALADDYGQRTRSIG